MLASGVEYTPWGDLMWEPYGLEDGTLLNGPLPKKGSTELALLAKQ